MFLAMGVGILTTYPEIAGIAGLEGLLVYSITSALPIMIFAFLGPIIRRKCPDGFVLTEWVFQRFGVVTGLYLSAFTILTMYLYMVGELTALQTCVESLTGVSVTPVLITECIVTSIYTCIGGFKVSFITDNIQGVMVLLLLIICSCAMGTKIDVNHDIIEKSGYLKSNKLGGQLIYILLVAIATNDCFLSGFWLRTFASRTDRDLLIGTSIASFVIFVFLFLIGFTGLLAVWGGYLESYSDNASNSFFIILSTMPGWVIGFVLVFCVILSTATFDSLQSAMVSSISNDLSRNKLPIVYIRVVVIIVMVPVIVVALKGADILQIYLIADLVSSSVIPILLLGLSDKFWFLTGWEVVGGGLGGLLGVFIFGTIYLGNARDGGRLLLLWDGLYVDNWSAFGAFVVAPFGGLLVGFIILAFRYCVLWIISEEKIFEGFKRPSPVLDKQSSEPEIVAAIDNYTT